MTIWDFSVDGASVIKVLRDANPPREQSFEALSLRMVEGIIYLYESGIYASAIKFEQIGDIEGVPPTDLQDAYDKIIAIIPSGGSGATPTLQEVTTAGNETTDNIIKRIGDWTLQLTDDGNGVPMILMNSDIYGPKGIYVPWGMQISSVLEPAVNCQMEILAERTDFIGFRVNNEDIVNFGNNLLTTLTFPTTSSIDQLLLQRDFIFPDKPEGTYTLATTDDIGDFVPYTGATADVNLGEFGLLPGNLQFDTTPTNIPTTAGSLVWNNSDGTLDLTLKGGNVTLQVGQESVLRVVNKTATNINLLEANYQAVRVTGAQGQRLKVDLAQATTDAFSAETIGLVTETINNNQEGFITTSGLVRGINTTGSLQSETWADGDILYLSPTIAGNITKVKPVAPNHLIIIGYVVHAHITQGSIFVKVDNGYELDELHNVKIATPTNGQALTYTSATDIWENKTITTVNDILFQDITINMPTNGSITVNNVVGTALTISGTPAIRTITDTSLFTRTTRVGLETTIVPANVFTFRQVVGYFSINTGFKASFKFGASTGATNSNVRYSIGIFPANFSVTNVDPTTFINCAAFARIDGSNNWNFIHNDATGTATAIDLGASFPANTVSTDIYYAVIETISGNIKYTLTRLNTGDTITSTVSTNLVAASTLLGMSAGCSNNTNAAICALDFGGMQLTKFT